MIGRVGSSSSELDAVGSEAYRPVVGSVVSSSFELSAVGSSVAVAGDIAIVPFPIGPIVSSLFQGDEVGSDGDRDSELTNNVLGSVASGKFVSSSFELGAVGSSVAVAGDIAITRFRINSIVAIATSTFQRGWIGMVGSAEVANNVLASVVSAKCDGPGGSRSVIGPVASSGSGALGLGDTRPVEAIEGERSAKRSVTTSMARSKIRA